MVTQINRKLVLGCGALIVALALGISLWPGNSDYPPHHAGPRVDVSIPDGATGSAIAHALQAAGVVMSSSHFVALELRDSRAQGISPGIHSIESHIPSQQALDEMLDPKLVRGLIKIPEASTFQDVLKVIRASSSISDDFSAKHSFSLPTFMTNRSLEGIIAPADYAFASGTSTTQAIQSMIENFKQSASEVGLSNGYQQYSPYQVLTVASMVQIEGDPADYSKVAQVIYNRLHIGMALQLNSTVQYASHLRGQINLSTAATQISSPYNTYRNVGLPPTPISNPSKSAMIASLHPATGDWLYFITVKPHDTRFTNSFAEFEVWVTLYNKNLRAGLFK
jgi:UPF0755 protein